MLTETQLVRPPQSPAPATGPLAGSDADRQVSARAPNLEELAAATQVHRITRSVVQASLEVLGGSRPLQQLADWLDPPSYERLQLRTNLVRSLNRATPKGGHDQLLHRNISVRSVRICRISENVYEASAVVVEHRRVRAVALRLERRRGQWKVTALEIG
ncbi:Rv3235 family protein [Arthrobacter flavus]|uniref:Rv3235 family protein n=1 Tax=Arthrobacter flavus TaxID=95172 RepID=A0ABW4QB86_9MICC